MPFRQHSRITDTRDLTATLPARGRAGCAHRVINLSEGGMLITGAEPVGTGEAASFELAGRDFSAAGVAEVVHHTSEATGLRFVGWRDQGDRQVRALISAPSPDPAHHIPGKYTG
jgi:hypothetical protein